MMKKGEIFKNACIIDGKPYDLELVSYSCKPWDGDLGGDIEETVYKCPLCGEGKLVRVDENTPGDRDHWAAIRCEKCNPGGLVYKTKSGYVMDFITRTPLEIAEEVNEEHELISKTFNRSYFDIIHDMKWGNFKLDCDDDDDEDNDYVDWYDDEEWDDFE